MARILYYVSNYMHFYIQQKKTLLHLLFTEKKKTECRGSSDSKTKIKILGCVHKLCNIILKAWNLFHSLESLNSRKFHTNRDKFMNSKFMNVRTKLKWLVQHFSSSQLQMQKRKKNIIIIKKTNKKILWYFMNDFPLNPKIISWKFEWIERKHRNHFVISLSKFPIKTGKLIFTRWRKKNTANYVIGKNKTHFHFSLLN